MFAEDIQVISDEDYSLKFLEYTSKLVLSEDWLSSKDLFSKIFKYGRDILKKFGRKTPIIFVVLKVLKIIRVECARILSGNPELEEQLTNQLFAETKIEIDDVSRSTLKDYLSEALSELTNEIVDGQLSLEEYGMKNILNEDLILTIGYSKLVFKILKCASENEKKFSVIVLEGHPLKGAAQMANKLGKLGVSVIVASERSSFTLLSKVDKVFVEADTVFADGGLLCRSGVHQICLDAKLKSVPVYVCLLSSRLSPLLSVEYTERSLETDSVNEISAFHPLDLMPSNLVSSLVTDIGSLHPSQFMSMTKDYFRSDDVSDFLAVL